jgi:hypothetical protein
MNANAYSVTPSNAFPRDVTSSVPYQHIGVAESQKAASAPTNQPPKCDPAPQAPTEKTREPFRNV